MADEYNRDELGRFAPGNEPSMGTIVWTPEGKGKVHGYGGFGKDKLTGSGLDIAVKFDSGDVREFELSQIRKMPASVKKEIALTKPEPKRTSVWDNMSSLQKIKANSQDRARAAATALKNKTASYNQPSIVKKETKAQRAARSAAIIADFKKKMGI